MSLDVTTRVYNHGFRIDPIVRTLLDTDFYKFLMLQLIRAKSPEVRATFGLISTKVGAARRRHRRTGTARPA